MLINYEFLVNITCEEGYGEEGVGDGLFLDLIVVYGTVLVHLVELHSQHTRVADLEGLDLIVLK